MAKKTTPAVVANNEAIDDALTSAFGDSVMPEVAVEDEEGSPEAPETEAEAEAPETDAPEAESDTPEPEVEAPAPKRGKKSATSTETKPEPDAYSDLDPLQVAALKRAGLEAAALAGLDLNARQMLADKLHSSFLTDSTLLDAAGRGKPAGAAATPPAAAGTPPAAPAAPEELGKLKPPSDDEVMKAFGLPTSAEFLEQYDQELHDKLYKPQVAMARIVAQVQAVVSKMAAERDAAVNAQHGSSNAQREMDQFFGAQTEFAAQYGSGTDWTINPQQYEMRRQVVEQADIMLKGAAALGRQLPIREALDRAQTIVMQAAIRASERDKGANETKKLRNATLHPPGRHGGGGKRTTSKQTAEQKAGDAIGEAAERLGIALMPD